MCYNLVFIYLLRSDLIRENFVLHMEATPTVERTPVQQTTGYQVNKSESITLQPERYPVGDEQLVPMQDSNSNALYIPNESVDPLSESSQSRPLSSDTKLQQPSSVSTGMYVVNMYVCIYMEIATSKFTALRYKLVLIFLPKLLI